MFVPLYSIPDDDAKWIDKTTGEDAPMEMLKKCSEYASFSIIGRNTLSDRIDTEYINHRDDYRKQGAFSIVGMIMPNLKFVVNGEETGPILDFITDL